MEAHGLELLAGDGARFETFAGDEEPEPESALSFKQAKQVEVLQAMMKGKPEELTEKQRTMGREIYRDLAKLFGDAEGKSTFQP